MNIAMCGVHITELVIVKKEIWKCSIPIAYEDYLRLNLSLLSPY